jgi:hypothetical protein
MTELLSFFNATGPLDLVLLLFNGALSAAICLLLVFAHPQQDAVFAMHGRLARYLLAILYGVMAVRCLMGWYYTPVEPAEVVVNAFVLWQVWLVQGDMSLLVRAIHALQVHRSNQGETSR